MAAPIDAESDRPSVELSRSRWTAWVMLAVARPVGGWLLREIHRTIGLDSPRLWELLRTDRVFDLAMLDFTLTAGLGGPGPDRAGGLEGLAALGRPPGLLRDADAGDHPLPPARPVPETSELTGVGPAALGANPADATVDPRDNLENIESV